LNSETRQRKSAAESADLNEHHARVHLHLHARLDGQHFIGVDAFRAIWTVIPGYRWLNHLTGLPVVYQATKLMYAIFARIRPMLPKRKNCDSGVCQTGEKSV
jgi:predicted DCC family thiol-disulfide oxidoreductase YuxK